MTWWNRLSHHRRSLWVPSITDLDSLEPHTVYEIKCHQCEMSIRTQGVNIKDQYERLAESGCIGCGNKELVVKKVDMSAAKKEQDA